MTLNGTVGQDFTDLSDPTATASQDGHRCAGTDGYDDIESGLQVTVTNESGTVIGTGDFGDGNITSGTCVFQFTIDDVPKAGFYQVEAGRRGTLRYSYADMQSKSWHVDLTLG
jgi:hypothetical protein